MKSWMWYVCAYTCEWIQVWSREGGWGVGGCLHLIAGRDWQCRIEQYLSTTELRKIGLSLMTFSSIETCTAPPPSYWKWLISGLVVTVLFLGGQSVMSTQHVGLEVNSLFYPYMDFSILPPTELKRREKNRKWEGRKIKYHLFALLTKWPKRDSFHASSSSFKCHGLKKTDSSISWVSVFLSIQMHNIS